MPNLASSTFPVDYELLLQSLSKREAAKQRRRLVKHGLLPPPREGFISELTQGTLDSALRAAQGVAATATEFGLPFGPDAEATLAGYRSRNRQIEPFEGHTVLSFRPENVGRAIGSGLGFTAVTAASAIPAALATGGSSLAATVAAGGGVFATMFGDTRREYRSEFPDLSDAEVDAITLWSTGLQAAAEVTFGLDAVLISGISRAAAGKAFNKYTAKGVARIVKKGLRGGLEEGTDEVTQGAIDDIALMAGGSKKAVRTFKQRREEFVGGFIPGVAGGTSLAAMERGPRAEAPSPEATPPAEAPAPEAPATKAEPSPAEDQDRQQVIRAALIKEFPAERDAIVEMAPEELEAIASGEPTTDAEKAIQAKVQEALGEGSDIRVEIDEITKAQVAEEDSQIPLTPEKQKRISDAADKQALNEQGKRWAALPLSSELSPQNKELKTKALDAIAEGNNELATAIMDDLDAEVEAERTLLPVRAAGQQVATLPKEPQPVSPPQQRALTAGRQPVALLPARKEFLHNITPRQRQAARLRAEERRQERTQQEIPDAVREQAPAQVPAQPEAAVTRQAPQAEVEKVPVPQAVAATPSEIPGETAVLKLAKVWEDQARKTDGGNGIAVGAGNIEYRWKAEGMLDVLRSVKRGMSITAAVDAAKQTAHETVEKHNQRRKNIHWQRWEGTADSNIVHAGRLLNQAQEAPQPQAEVPAQEAVAKQPWEMTRGDVVWGEFTPDGRDTDRALKGRLARWTKIQSEAKGQNIDIDVVEQAIAKEKTRIARANEHRAAVKQAIAQGLPVPSEVLADYPDLQPPADLPRAGTVPPSPPQAAAAPIKRDEDGRQLIRDDLLDKFNAALVRHHPELIPPGTQDVGPSSFFSKTTWLELRLNAVAKKFNTNIADIVKAVADNTSDIVDLGEQGRILIGALADSGINKKLINGYLAVVKQDFQSAADAAERNRLGGLLAGQVDDEFLRTATLDEIRTEAADLGIPVGDTSTTADEVKAVLNVDDKQFHAQTRTPLERIARRVELVKRELPWAKVRETPSGGLTIQTPTGEVVEVGLPDTIPIDPDALRQEYGDTIDPKAVTIGGAFFPQLQVMLFSGTATEGTIAHETAHLAEKIANLTPAERALLTRRYPREGSWASGYETWRGHRRVRGPISRVFQKIHDAMTRFASALGYTTESSIFQRVESGQAFQGQAAQTQATTATQFEVKGEWWLSGGQALFADGDVGDFNHEGMVLEDLRFEAADDLGIDEQGFDPQFEDVTEEQQQELSDAGWSDTKIATMQGFGDARDFAMQELGQVRVAENNIQLWGLTAAKLREIGNGLSDAYEEQAAKEKYTVEDMKARRVYEGVPFSVFDSGNMSALRRFDSMIRYQAKQALPDSLFQAAPAAQFQAQRKPLTISSDLAPRAGGLIVDAFRDAQEKPQAETEVDQRARAQQVWDKNGEDIKRQWAEGDYNLDAGEDLVSKRINGIRAFEEMVGDGVETRDVGKLADASVVMANYRDFGTELAKALRIGFQKKLDPVERLKAIFAFRLTRLSKGIIKHSKTLPAGERKAFLKRRAGEEIQKLYDALAAKGIDPSAMTDEQWLDPRIQAQISREKSIQAASMADKFFEVWLSGLVSGITTQGANFIGNTFMASLEFTAQRMTEAAINSLPGMHDPRSASFKEFKYINKALTINNIKTAINYFWLAFDTEMSAFQGDFAKGKVEASTSVGGIKIGTTNFGRLWRIPLRILTGADDLALSLIIDMEASAQAYRIAAKEEGLIEDDLTNRMAALLLDKTSPAYMRAFKLGNLLTFKEKLGPIGQAVQRTRRDVAGVRYVAPFTLAPGNIFKQTIKKSPLGSVRLLYKVARAGAVKLGFDEKTGHTYKKHEFIRDSAEQVLALGLVWALYGMVMSGDDEDGLPTITGSDVSRGEPGKRALQFRTAPATSVRFRGGKTYMNYGRIEPLSGSVAIIVDGLLQLKAAKNGQEWDKAFTAVFSTAKALIRDKTFMRGAGDLIRAFEAGDKFAIGYASNFATSWMPNIIKQAGRASDPFIREQKVVGQGAPWWTKKAAMARYQALPFSAKAPPPKVDLYGRDITKFSGVSPFSSFLYRMAIPLRRKDVSNVSKFDLLLLNWNTAHPGSELYPRQPSHRYVIRGETFYMTPEEYHPFEKRAGELTLERLERRRLNIDDPTKLDIKFFSDAITSSRRRAKREFLSRRPKRR